MHGTTLSMSVVVLLLYSTAAQYYLVHVYTSSTPVFYYLVHVCAGVLIEFVGGGEDDERNLTITEYTKLVRFLHHTKLTLVKRNLKKSDLILEELGFRNRLKFSNPYIFAT